MTMKLLMKRGRAPVFQLTQRRAFTLVELLTVMAVIAILAGLILATSGYVQRKAATSRAEGEIAALSAACESYKADNGTYPMASGTTDAVYAFKAGSSAGADYDPSKPVYLNSSRYLYGQLSGDTTYSANRQITAGAKSYFQFKPTMLLPAGGNGAVTAIADPFGNSYGYSTAYAAWVENGSQGQQNGYNPTFDLWSTGGTTTISTSANQAKWIKNW